MLEHLIACFTSHDFTFLFEKGAAFDEAVSMMSCRTQEFIQGEQILIIDNSEQYFLNVSCELREDSRKESSECAF